MISLCVLCCLLNQSPQDAEMLKAVRIGYEANRTALRHGSIRFEQIEGRVPSEGAAVTGVVEDRHIARGVFLIDGDLARYERVFEVEEMSATTVTQSENSETGVLSSERVLTDGKVTLWDRVSPSTRLRGAKPVHRAQIDPGRQAFESAVIMPLELGELAAQGSLSRTLDLVLQPGSAARLKSVGEQTDTRGENLLRFAVEFERGTTEYTIDLAHGCIPLRADWTSKDGRNRIVTRYDDVRQVSNKCWLPFLCTIYWYPGTIRQVKILEADFSQAPSRAAFALEFPELIPLVDASRHLRYQPRKSWSLTNLPRSSEPGVRSITPTPGPSPPIRIETRTSGFQWKLVAGVLGLILVAGGIVRLWIRRSRFDQ